MAESNQMSGGSEKREYEKKAVNMKGNSGLLGLTQLEWPHDASLWRFSSQRPNLHTYQSSFPPHSRTLKITTTWAGLSGAAGKALATSARWVGLLAVVRYLGPKFSLIIFLWKIQLSLCVVANLLSAQRFLHGNKLSSGFDVILLSFQGMI